MSRVVTHSETFTGKPTSYDTGYSAYDVSNVTSGYNPVTNTTASRRAVIYLNRGSGATTNFPYIFDCSSIPSNANITSISCSARTTISTTNEKRVATKQIQMYSNTTAKGTASDVSGSSGTPLTLTCGTWTRQELNNARIVLHAVRGTQRTTDSFYFQFWGSTLSIAYTWNETFYEFTCTSSAQGAGMATGETTSGGSYTATITGLSSLSNITIKDNGTDVTSTFTKSGNNYVKTYSNVSEDHVLTIQSSSSPTVNGYVKKNSQYKSVSNTYQKMPPLGKEKPYLPSCGR